LRGGNLLVGPGAICAIGMSFQVARKGKRAEDRRLVNGSHTAIGQMVYQGERRDEFSVFCQVAFESGHHVSGPEPAFQVAAPLGEYFSRRLIKTKEWKLFVFFVELRAGSFRG
jgi:hypothetical protein